MAEQTNTYSSEKVNTGFDRVITFARTNAFPIVLFVFLRVWTMVWASASASLVVPGADVLKQYYGVEPWRDALIAPWQRWDTIWYTKIALEGYAADQSVHFPPLYPFLIRIVSPVFANNVVLAGLVISGSATLASFILLYQLARNMFEENTARRALLFFGVFPTAFFLFAAYTEPLFLAFALGAFMCATRSRWLEAGILGAFAAMTRGQGTLFIFPLAVEFWMQYRRGEISLARAWTLIPVPIGGIVHVLWITFQFGSPLVYFQGESLMHRASLPWNALIEGWKAVLYAPSLSAALLSFLDPFCAIVLLAALIWSTRRLPLSLTAYLAIIIAPSLFILTTYSDAYPLTSVSRFVVLAFPLFLLLGSLPKRWWETILLAFSFLLQTLLLVLFSAWVFVR